VLPQIKKVGSLLESVVVGDQGEVAVMAFDHRLRVLQEFTNDTAKLSEAMKKMTAGSSSARMVDAVEESVRMLRRRPPNRRRFILLISETRDITSEAKAKSVLTAAQFANVTVYTLNISRVVTTVTAKQQPPRPDSRLPAAMPLPGGVPSTPHTIAQKTGGPGGAADFVPLLIEIFRDVKAIFISNHAEVFTKGTGGAEFSFVRQRGLEDAISRIGEEIHSQYMITYSPSNKLEGGFHEIKVLVNHPGAKPRTRPGYWLAAINQ
ncbi:MAG: VWA domain-containing protein, partial [Bryobacteraceae bacterium]